MGEAELLWRQVLVRPEVRPQRRLWDLQEGPGINKSPHLLALCLVRLLLLPPPPEVSGVVGGGHAG